MPTFAPSSPFWGVRTNGGEPFGSLPSPNTYAPGGGSVDRGDRRVEIAPSATPRYSATLSASSRWLHS